MLQWAHHTVLRTRLVPQHLARAVCRSPMALQWWEERKIVLLSNWLQLLYWCAAEQSVRFGLATLLLFAALLPLDIHTFSSSIHRHPTP